MSSIKLKLQILFTFSQGIIQPCRFYFIKMYIPPRYHTFISMLHSSERGKKDAHSRSKRGTNSGFQVPENKYDPQLPSWLKVRQIIAFHFVFPKSYIHQLQNWDNNIQVIIRQYQSILNYENLHLHLKYKIYSLTHINKTNSLTCCKIIYWQISAKKKLVLPEVKFKRLFTTLKWSF